MREPPIDRGWAWCCVLGAHICNFFLIGGFKTLGILFVEFNDEFHPNKAASASMIALLGASMSICAPIATALSEYYTERRVVIVGGILVFLGSFITSFADSMTMIIFGFGITTGVGYGCILGPAMVLVGRYFRKRRSLASGMAIAGGSMGQLLIPLILRFLIDEFSWRGGLFIYSALILHVCVGGALFRPLTFYTRPGKPVHSQKPYLPNSTPQKWLENHDESVLLDPLRAQSTPNIPLTMKTNCNANLRKEEKPIHFISRISVEQKLYSESNPAIHTKNHRSDVTLNRTDMLFSSTGSIMFSPIQLRRRKDTADEAKLTELGEEEPRPSFFRLLKGSFCGCCGKSDKKQPSLFDWGLFKRPLYILFVVATMFGQCGYVNLFFMIPPHCEDIGLTKSNAALLVAIAGVCDLLSRILGGWFADCGFVKKNIIMGGSLLITGICTVIFPYFNSFEGLIAYAVVIGVLGGFYVSLFVVLLIDYIGIENTPKGFGMALMVMGFANMPAPVILGYIRERTGSWYAGFIFCSIAMAMASLCLFSERWVMKSDKKYNANVENNNPRDTEA